MHPQASLSELVERQRRALLQCLPVSLQTRRDRLRRIIQLLADNANALAAAMDRDFAGRDHTFSKMNDVLGSLMSLDTARTQLDRWMKSERRTAIAPFSWFGAKAQVEYSPRGVVAIIGSWNAPLYTLMAPLSSALAAGNSAILKPSEHTAETAALLARLVSEHFSPDELAVVNGNADVAAELTRCAVDLIVFTGSTPVGRQVMAAAADRLTPVILELGGKSPVVIGRSAALDVAAQRIALGKTANAGQLCISPDTVHVPRESVDAFCKALVNHYRQLTASAGAETAIANERQLGRLRTMLAEARTTAAAIYESKPASQCSGRVLPLSLIVAPAATSSVAREEIFGPMLLVQPYDRFETLLEVMQTQPKPLALYYFGEDRAERAQLFARIRSGGGAINDVMLHASVFNAPFGGAGESGMGCYHGREGFAAMSHARTLFKAGWWDPRAKFGMLPPYSDRLRGMIDKTISRFNQR